MELSKSVNESVLKSSKKEIFLKRIDDAVRNSRELIQDIMKELKVSDDFSSLPKNIKEENPFNIFSDILYQKHPPIVMKYDFYKNRMRDEEYFNMISLLLNKNIVVPKE